MGVSQKKNHQASQNIKEDRYTKSEKHMKVVEKNDKKKSTFEKSHFNYTQLHLAALKKEGPKPIGNS